MKKRNLFLGDYENFSYNEVIEDIVSSYCVEKHIVDEYQIIVAHLDEGSYEGDSYFLMFHKGTGKFYENCGGHCSCYGFEDQFEPEETSVEYLMSEHYNWRDNTEVMDFLKSGILQNILREKKLERILN